MTRVACRGLHVEGCMTRVEGHSLKVRKSKVESHMSRVTCRGLHVEGRGS